MEATKKIWMDGTFVDWDDAQVHVLSHTLHYGLGVFEGIRCYDTAAGPAIFRLPEHIDRLFNSAHIAGLKMPFSREDIGQAIVDTVKVNEVRECYIRPSFIWATENWASTTATARCASVSPFGLGAPTWARAHSPKAFACASPPIPATTSTS